jgi:hypothetical protein
MSLVLGNSSASVQLRGSLTLVTYDWGLLLRLEGPTSGRAESSRKRGALSTKKAEKRQKINDWVGDFQRPILARLTEAQIKCRVGEWFVKVVVGLDEADYTGVTDPSYKSANVRVNGEH